jgi:predicted glycosyltransferase
MTRVIFLTCHLTGSGHLARTLALARGVIRAGGEALVLSGGRPLPHFDPGEVPVLQLPPVAVANADYSTLRDAEGRPADAALLARRGEMIAAALREARPDAFVTELFPFGRRILAAEFEAALARAARLGARIHASVRDLPEPPKKPKRYVEAEARLRRWYRSALVHGDPALAPFGRAWAEADAIADLLRPTGYVVEPPPAPEGDPNEVLVAEGGGPLGRRLLETAARAAARSDRPWRLRIGGADAADTAARLNALAGGRAVAEPAAPDYRARLGAAAASVSLFGYNTAAELLACGTPAVIAPFATPLEREQAIRADAFAGLPQFERLDAADLTPEALSAAVESAVARGRAPAPAADLSGVETSARILLGQE